MANAIGIFLLCAPFALIMFLGGFMLLGNLFRAYAKSRSAWFASALVLPHFASKLMDRIYDALIAGNLGDAIFYGLPLVIILVVLDLLLCANAQD